MYDSDLYRRIRAGLDDIRILDTHEHLTLPYQLAEVERIDFGRLFSHYANSDLISAGMPVEDMAEVTNMGSRLSPKEKWQLLKPWYRKSWNTTYCECIRIAMCDLYGIEDLSEQTVEPLSQKMNAVSRETWTREVFNRAHIDIALEQNLWLKEPVYPSKAYPDLFIYDMADPFSNLEVERLSGDSGMEIGSLADYLKVVDHYFDKFAAKASAYKIVRAYNRPIYFADVDFATAEKAFADRGRAVEDYVIHHCLKRAGDHNLPVKIHTGIQDGNCNDVTNSRPSLLINLFMKYPNVKFDIYHASWPYSDELMAIAKQFPNVCVDFCWLWIISPTAARGCLHRMLETVPANKIHGFGGDFFFVEGSYGHAMIAKREIARVLEEKVQEGRFTEEYAAWVARSLLRENALENFRVEEKRGK